MKLIYSFVTLIYCLSAYSIGGKGPLELSKTGLQNKASVVLDKIGIEEHLGESIDLNLPFVDENGKDVRLGAYFNDKPVFMLLIYYECPTLCNTHLNSLVNRLKDFEWKVGDKFEFVAISIDPDESPKLAKQKLDAYMDAYGHPETRAGWHFLTGEQASIDAIAKQIGFKFAWEPREQQWAHAAAAYVITPEGKISYYHHGLDIQPKVLRLSLVEAAANQIGTIIDRVVLFCLQYDPNKKTYAFYAFNIMKVGAILTALFLFIYLFRFWKKENTTTV